MVRAEIASLLLESLKVEIEAGLLVCKRNDCPVDCCIQSDAEDEGLDQDHSSAEEPKRIAKVS